MDQIGSERRQSIIVILRPAVFITTFCPSMYPASFKPCLNATAVELSATSSTSVGTSGTIGELLPGGSYEALRAQRARTSPNRSHQPKKTATGKVILMDRHRS